MTAGFAVVLGLSPTGLYVVRELGRAGVAVYGVDESRRCGASSCYLQPDGAIVTSDATLAESLLALASQRGERGVLIATSDRYIDWLVVHGEAIKSHYSYQSSYSAQAYSQLVDKEGLHQAALTAGVSLPRTQLLVEKELQSANPPLEPPFLLKPVEIHRIAAQMRGKKVLVVQGRGDWCATAETCRVLGGQWLAQEIIPGPESNLVLYAAYFNQRGEACEEFTARKLRQYPPYFGSASLVASEPLPVVVEASRHCLGALSFQGVVGTEFKLDPRDGSYKLIEINPRPTLWFAATHAAGKRIALAAFSDLGGISRPATGCEEEAVVWRYGLKDLASAWHYFRHGQRNPVLPPPELPQLSISRRQCWPVFSQQDWRPVVTELGVYANKAVQRLQRQSSGAADDR